MSTQVITALETLEAFIRTAPDAQNASSALTGLAAVVSHVARINPALQGYSVGSWREESYSNEGVEVSPLESRLARNAATKAKFNDE